MSIHELMSHLCGKDANINVGILVSSESANDSKHFMPLSEVKLMDINGKRRLIIGSVEYVSSVMVSFNGEPAL